MLKKSALSIRRSYISSFAFCVPAITGVMSHLVGHVLSKPQLLPVNATLQHEHLDPPHEVTKRLIGYQFLGINESQAK